MEDLLDRVRPEDWIVAASAVDVQRQAHLALRKHGCLLLRGVFPPSVIDAMHREYASRYGALDARAMLAQSERPEPNPIAPRGKARFEITLRMTGAFCRPDVFANPLLRDILGPLFGADMQLNSLSIVVSFPGAPVQQIHRDHSHLFITDPDVGPNLPVYAVNVGVPLIDVDLETGPTGVWPGSHRWPSNIEAQPSEVTAFPLWRGDCLLLDYRTLHTGLPNRSAPARPILYMVYARGWFHDDVTHFGLNSPDIPLEDYRSLPESARQPLYRGLSQALRGRGRDIEPSTPAPAPAHNPTAPGSRGWTGRNDPCPCGSGKKYKHCHGRLA
jgi:hypothetical protein